MAYGADHRACIEMKLGFQRRAITYSAEIQFPLLVNQKVGQASCLPGVDRLEACPTWESVIPT